MAGGFGNAAITDILKLLFQNISMANWGDVAGILKSATDGSLYVALHTADPGAAGSQNTSEAGYTGYLRVPVARSTSGFTVTAQAVSPAAVVTFAAGTGGGETITYASIGRDSSGAGKILARCALQTNLLTGNGATPSLGTGTTFTMA